MKFAVATLVPALLALSALAAPSSDAPRPCRLRPKEHGNFDDLTYTDSPRTNVGKYRGLVYSGFTVDRYLYLTPPSKPNFAAAYDPSAAHYFRIDTSHNPGATFDLESLYAACQYGIPQPKCTISVKATKSGGKVYTKKVVYPAQNSSSSGVYDYKKFEFGDDGHFKELTRVDFEAVIGGKKAPGFLLDNVETITCYP